MCQLRLAHRSFWQLKRSPAFFLSVMTNSGATTINWLPHTNTYSHLWQPLLATSSATGTTSLTKGHECASDCLQTLQNRHGEAGSRSSWLLSSRLPAGHSCYTWPVVSLLHCPSVNMSKAEAGWIWMCSYCKLEKKVWVFLLSLCTVGCWVLGLVHAALKSDLSDLSFASDLSGFVASTHERFVITCLHWLLW